MSGFTYLGGLVCVIVALCIAFLMFAIAIDKLQTLWQRCVGRALVSEMQRMGVLLGSQVHWFSSRSVDQAATWHAFCDALARGNWPDVAQLRDNVIPAVRKRLAREWELPDA